MAESLDPVLQEFIAQTTQYVDELDKATAAAVRFALANKDATEAVDRLQSAIDDLDTTGLTAGLSAAAGAADREAGAAKDAAAATAGMGAAESEAAKATAGAAAASGAAASANKANAAAANDAAGAAFRLSEFNKAISESYTAEVAAGAALLAETNALSRAQGTLAAAEALVAEEADRAGQAIRDLASGDAMAAAMTRSLAEADATLAAGEAVAAEAADRHAAALLTVTRAGLAAGASLGTAAAATDAAGAAAGRAWRPWWLLGNTWRTALHWIVAGSAEMLAVAIPALVALGAGMLVALQGAQNVQRHFQALYAATESTASAFHTTMGDVLGLGHALQSAQDAANPGVYEILGSVVNDAKSHFADFAGAGLQVVHMLDEFSARVTVDLTKGALGGQLHAFLAGMVTDLQQLGQVLGNFGHALVNVFSAMPGLVHVLLSLVDAASHLILIVSEIPAPLLTFAIAMEEVFRWGGLLLGVLARLAGVGTMMNAFAAGGGFITRFGAAVKALVAQGGIAIIWVGQMIGKLAGLIPVAAEAGAAVEVFGADVAIAGAEMDTNMIVLVTALAAGLVFLVAKLASAKTATEQWIAASDKAVASASDLSKLPTIYSQLAQTTTRLAASQGTLANQAGSVSFRLEGQAAVTRTASQSSADLANHMISLVHTAQTAGSNVNWLAGQFHISAAGALALANAAGVNLTQGLLRGTQAGQIAVQMINNLRTGLGAMSAPIGVIGADMEAMGVQSQLTASKVGQVNQALDQFVATTSGGMSTLAQFEAALTAMGHDAQATSVGINGAIHSISRSAQQMGYTLQGMGPKAQQSWQQFAQAVQQGQQVLDTMRTGMAEGVVSAGQYNTAIRTVAGSLLPFTSNNRTAVSIVSQLAQEAGFPATTSLRTLAQQLGVTGARAKGQLVPAVEAAIARMANLNQVARNLSATVSTQLDSAMAGAIVNASHLNQAYLKWANDVKSNKAPETLAKDMAKIRQAQDFVNRAEAEGTRLLNQSNTNAGKLGSTLHHTAGQADTLTKATQQVAAALKDHQISAKVAEIATYGLQGKVAALSSTESGSQGTRQAVNQELQRQQTQSQQTAQATQNLQQKIIAMSGAAQGSVGKLAATSIAASRVGSSALTAALRVAALATAINSLQSKTVTLTVNTVQTTTNLGVAHHASGTASAARGLAIVGERGPELMYMHGGESVTPAPQTAGILAALASAGAGAGDGGDIVLHLNLQMPPPGEYRAAEQRATLRYGKRNGRTGLSLPYP